MRSMHLAFVLVLAAILAVGFFDASVAQSQAMFQNGPQHPGVYASDAAGEFVGLKWKFKSGGRIFASPVICDALCYIGSEDTFLYALDAETGKEKWRFKTGGAVNSSAAAAGGTVFFASMDGFLYAVEAGTGKLRWKFATKGEKTLDMWDPLLSSPCIDGGVVYFGSGDGNLYAVDAETGAEIWRFATDGIIHSSPAVYQDLVYFGNGEGKVYAVLRKTGTRKWSFKTLGYRADMPKGEVLGSPSIASGILYIGAKDHAIYALDALTGEEKWHRQAYPGWVISAPAVKDGMVYYGKTGNYRVCASDAMTGEPKWDFNSGYFIYSSPAVAGGTLYIGGFNGKLFALDALSGKMQWSFQTDGSKENYATFFNEIGSFRREIYNYDGGETDQNLFDYLTTMGSILSSPWVSGNAVYFGSTDGCLYALAMK